MFDTYSTLQKLITVNLIFQANVFFFFLSKHLIIFFVINFYVYPQYKHSMDCISILLSCSIFKQHNCTKLLIGYTLDGLLVLEVLIQMHYLISKNNNRSLPL